MNSIKNIRTSMVLSLLIISLLSFSSSLFAQAGSEKSIRQDFSTYIKALVDNEFEKSTEYLYPEFFEIFPKDLMIQTMDKTFNDPEIEINLFDPKIISVNPTTKLDSFHFAILKYSNSMSMKYNNLIVGSEEEKTLTIDLLKGSLFQSFGEENVSFNKETEIFNIYSEKNVVARSKNGISDWKFLVLEKGQMPILKRLVPESIINSVPTDEK